jgi:hypothetical protein
MAISVYTGYLLRKQSIGLLPSRRRSILQNPTHPADPVVFLVRLDEGVDYLRSRKSSSLAKNAAVCSTGERNGLRQCSSRRAVSEGLARSGVELERHQVEVVLAIHR